MNAPRLLVVSRLRPMDLFASEEDPRLVRLKKRDPDYLGVLRSEQEHLAITLAKVQSVAQSRGFHVETRRLNEGFDPEVHDLVVPVGGDGTVLEVSHFVRTRAVLGVNSSPGRSVGFFCACHADGFGAQLDAWVAGRATECRATRMEVSLGDKPIPFPVLNDALYSHANPAAMSKYVLRIGRTEELQNSSGVWISTGAGSTAAIRSAGGHTMAMTSANLQYRVREPYDRLDATYRLLGGEVDGERGLLLVSRMETARFFVDGHYRRFDLAFGDEVRFRRSDHSLRLVGIGAKP